MINLNYNTSGGLFRTHGYRIYELIIVVVAVDYINTWLFIATYMVFLLYRGRKRLVTEKDKDVMICVYFFICNMTKMLMLMGNSQTQCYCCGWLLIFWNDEAFN